MDIIKWFSKERSIPFYTGIILIAIIFGIYIRYLFDSMVFICENTSVSLLFSNYLAVEIPRIHGSFFFGILLPNAITALCFFFFPYFIVLLLNAGYQIEINSHGKHVIPDFYSLTNFLPISKMLIFIFCIVWGIKSFYLLNCAFKLLPFQIFIFMILPHGIIEIPAFILSVVLGLKSADYFIKEINGRKKMTFVEFKPIFKTSLLLLGFYMAAILFAILIAAIIESWITPQIAISAFERYFQINKIPY